MKFLPHQVIAHRGASAHAPENTLAAFRRARELGAHWVELDVSLSADDVPVIVHDDTLDRTTSLAGPVRSATVAQLAAADAGSWFHPDFAGEPVPTLAAAFALFARIGLSVNVEIKPVATAAERMALCEAVRAALDMRPSGVDVVISSFDPEALVLMRALSGPEPLALLLDNLPQNWPTLVERTGASAVHLDMALLTADVLAQMNTAGLKVRVWTCNDPARLVPFWPLGLDAVITDDPSLFLGP